MKNYEVKISPSVTNFLEINIAQIIGEKKEKKKGEGEKKEEKRELLPYT